MDAKAATRAPQHQNFRTCSDDEDYAVFGGATTSEPDTDELMDGRAEAAAASGGGGRPSSSSAPVFHAGAAAAVAGGVGTTSGDEWLFDIQRRAPVAVGAAAAPLHPGCSGVAAYAMMGGGGAPPPANNNSIDADIDDLLADFKSARQLEKEQQRQREEKQKQQRQQVADDDVGGGRIDIQRVSLASLGRASPSSAAVRFVTTLHPLPSGGQDEEGPLLFSDAAGAAAAAAAAPPSAAVAAVAAPPPPPPPPRRAQWAPSLPLPGNGSSSRTAVVGPGASTAYEDEALSFSRARRRPAAAAAPDGGAAVFRHPGM